MGMALPDSSAAVTGCDISNGKYGVIIKETVQIQDWVITGSQTEWINNVEDINILIRGMWICKNKLNTPPNSTII